MENYFLVVLKENLLNGYVCVCLIIWGFFFIMYRSFIVCWKFVKNIFEVFFLLFIFIMNYIK